VSNAASVKLTGRKVFGGRARGKALVCAKPLSFLGGVDPITGLIQDTDQPVRGESVADRILVFPRGRGSTVGSYVIYELKCNGIAPAGIVNVEAEPIIATGAIMSHIPMVDRIDIAKIPQGAFVEMDGDAGLVNVLP
jgi:phosphomecalonate degydratase small subunit